ncbi:MAG: Mfa1 family fimbria major subunit [Parabacteroides sp.]
MNVKSTLWALAFACAAVSCSDDIDAPANENQENGGNGTATMKVIVSTDVVTKASADAEEGDGNEAGTKEESEVKDLTVFLYEVKTVPISADLTIDGSQSIVGSGFAEVDQTTASDHPDKHSWEAVVNVEIKDGFGSWSGKSYAVVAVANLGAGAQTLIGQVKDKTVKDLADYLQTEIQTTSGFVMSTHQMNDGQHNSIITFPAADQTQTVPEVEVFVERLAAKVRINKASSVTDYTYTLSNGDQVALNNAVVVNQLSSGSYLLKRVNTVTESDLAEELSSTDATGDVLLGNEMYKDETANWVIDPWTRSKTDVTNLPNGLTYDNYIIRKDGEKRLGNAELWKNLTGSKDLTDTEDPIHLAYIRENTTMTAQQLNGFSTGVMFKATYTPKYVSVIADDGKSVDSDGTLGESGTFYTYEQAKFGSLEAIFAYTLAKQVDGESSSTDYLLYDSFEDGITVKAFRESKTYTENRVADPFGYIKYLRDAVEEENASDNTQLFSFTTYMSEESLPESVKEYKGGECYYFYWIRHENNDKYNKVGPMEFAIVRNNIYDLTVTGISGLGEAGADVPNETVLDEDETAKMTVTVKVKNWVIRENNSIIL